MTDFAAAADKVIGAYNDQDWDTFVTLIVDDLDFGHYNRDFELSSRDELVNVVKAFAADLLESREFEAPERVTVQGNVVVREGYWRVTTKAEVPAFGMGAGETKRFRFATCMRFDDDGMLVEWKDHG